MFTVEHRDHVRERVLDLARTDPRVTAGALTGSTAVGAEDEWSDIDVAFGIADGEPELRRALAVATACLIGELEAGDPALCARLTPPLQEFGAPQAVAERGRSPRSLAEP